MKIYDTKEAGSIYGTVPAVSMLHLQDVTWRTRRIVSVYVLREWLLHRQSLLDTATSSPSLSQGSFLHFKQLQITHVKPVSQLRFDYDYDYDEKLTCSFFCSRRIASNGSRCARYVVVGSLSYRSRIERMS